MEKMLLLLAIACLSCEPSTVDFRCDFPLERIVHKEGNHKATPSYLYNRDLEIGEYRLFEWVISFDKTAVNRAHDPNPWNKALGVTWNGPLEGATENSFMLAWRPNLDEGFVELCPYFHNADGDRFHAAFPGGLYPEIPIISVAVDDCIDVAVIIDRVNHRVSYIIDGEMFDANLSNYGLFDMVGMARYINAWYGGPDPAPVDTQFYLGKI